MSDDGVPAADPAHGNPGAIVRLMGAILMMLGVLDSLLTLRAGIPAYQFLVLIAIGAAVFAAGAIVRVRHRQPASAGQPEGC